MLKTKLQKNYNLIYYDLCVYDTMTIPQKLNKNCLSYPYNGTHKYSCQICVSGRHFVH